VKFRVQCSGETIGRGGRGIGAKQKPTGGETSPSKASLNNANPVIQAKAKALVELMADDTSEIVYLSF
jgi:hypothetical protein